MRKQARAIWALDILKSSYPDADCALHYRTPFELLVATILSAQCTDERVNQVTANLFEKYPGPQAFAEAELDELEQDVRPTGFFRNKAKSIQGTAQEILRLHAGEVPNDMQALVALPGVGRKTASVVMGNAFGKAEGVVVDTHVGRISKLLKLTKHDNPVKIEQDLMKLIPEADWVLFPHLMIAHGRAVCKARRPRCQECPLNSECPSAS